MSPKFTKDSHCFVIFLPRKTNYQKAYALGVHSFSQGWRKLSKILAANSEIAEAVKCYKWTLFAGYISFVWANPDPVELAVQSIGLSLSPDSTYTNDCIEVAVSMFAHAIPDTKAAIYIRVSAMGSLVYEYSQYTPLCSGLQTTAELGFHVSTCSLHIIPKPKYFYVYYALQEMLEAAHYPV